MSEKPSNKNVQVKESINHPIEKPSIANKGSLDVSINANEVKREIPDITDSSEKRTSKPKQ